MKQSKEQRAKSREQKLQNIILYAICSVLLAMGLFACSGQQGAGEFDDSQQRPVTAVYNAPPVILSILPAESAGSVYQGFLPLKYYLERILRRPVIVRVAKDYESAVHELGTGQVHMACLDPATYCEVRARYKNKVAPLVMAIGRDGSRFRSVLAVKDGSGIDKLVDVRGKRLALGNQQSSFSYLIPLAMLNDVGIRSRDFAAADFLQQEDRVALSVLIGDHDVGAMSEFVAKKYVDDGLKIIKTSDAIPHYILCASDMLPRDAKELIIKNLVFLKDRESLKNIGEFAVAEDRDVDVIRVMIKNLTGKDYREYGPKTIKVAILPLYSAITLYDRYDPLMRYLSQKTGYDFRLVVPKDFDDFIRVVKSGQVDFSYQNPYIFALIDREFDIKPLVTTIGEDSYSDEGAEGGASFRGVIITKADSPIKDVRELRGKKVLITSPKSAGGYLSQRLFLLQMGIDTEKDLRLIDAKRQENVILGVYRGEADAGFVRESALAVWKDAVDMEKIKVLSKTKPLPNWPLALCGNTRQSLVSDVRKLLVGLKDKEILKAAKIKGFMPADEAEFEGLKRY